MVFVLDSENDSKNVRDAQEPKSMSSSRVVGQLWNSNPFDDDLIGTFEIDFRGVAASLKANDGLLHKAWYVIIQYPIRTSDALFESFGLKYSVSHNCYIFPLVHRFPVDTGGVVECTIAFSKFVF